MNVLMINQRSWGVRFGHDIACTIKQNIPEARFACITSGLKTFEEFHRTQKEIDYEFIRSCDLYDLGITHALSFPSLRDIEEELGVQSIWEIVQIDRIITMDPGKKYWYDYSRQMTNDQICSLVRHLLNFIKRIELDFSPDVIIGPNLLHLAQLMLYHYFKRRGVTILMLTSSYVRLYSVIDSSWDNSIPEIRDRYHSLLSDPQWSPSKFAKNYISEFRKKYIMPEALEVTSKRAYYRMSDLVTRSHRIFHLFAYLTKKRRELNPFKLLNSIDNNTFMRHITNYFAANYNRYVSKRLPYLDIHRLPEKFVLMLLQVDPENSTMLWAPHYTNQIEIARQVAMSLPGDFRLIVKEHPWMVGKRRKSYYQKLLAIPNVELISPSIDSYRLLKTTKLVVTIGGTAAFEMALLGKRSLIFSNMVYRVLPHVVAETDFTKLPRVLSDLLWDEKDVHEEWDRHLCAYIDAVQQVGFQVEYGARWEGDMNRRISALTSKMIEKIRGVVQPPAVVQTSNQVVTN